MNEYLLGETVLYMDKSGFTVPAIIVCTRATHPHSTLRERSRAMSLQSEVEGQDYYEARLWRKGAQDLFAAADAADQLLPCPSADHLYTLNVLAGPDMGIQSDVGFSATFRPGCFRGLA